MNSPVELWKKHPDIDGIEVSSFGRVRSVKGHYYKSYQTNRGYLNVRIKIDGKWITKSVHRLVAEAFVPNPNSMMEVNHKDNGRTNNGASNLEWVTHSYNMKYREEFGESARRPLFTVNLNTLEVSHFTSRIEASRMLGLSLSRISRSINSRRGQVHEFCFVNDDGDTIDIVKQKLHDIGEDNLTASDEESTKLVSQVLATCKSRPKMLYYRWKKQQVHQQNC